ncbi:hypothetical protein KC332_g35 [Hortaea werneckii]|nr:hypothetical protein KC332_g35 [Hortaea werneckii]
MAAADFACRVDGETRIDIFDVSVRAGAKVLRRLAGRSWIVELGILIEGVSSSSGHSMVDLIAHAAYRPCPCHQHRCFASRRGEPDSGRTEKRSHRRSQGRHSRAAVQVSACHLCPSFQAEVDRILHDLPANLEVRTRRVVDRSRLWVARNLSAEVHIRALCLRNPEAEGGRLICWSQLSLGIRDVSVLEVELPEGSGFHIGLD